ncbi:gametocyte-specific factor 1-like isoform X1 [Hemiscyllium ocellatum]|uniref:gametocyte-specific factor 1-like isoform X1 n=1 Tax=Hemiscyllium ocellatum TaxID=170820 RepID=UPI002965F8E7|nr:gametocyte-specific factor 1-like isoform X1 [Hemiscyllium ocellatum]
MSSIDPDDLLQCPYDQSHRIRACRFPYHLVKCRKNFPDKARNLESCPFNARHRIPKAEMKHHITVCVDKKVIEEDFVRSAQRKPCDIPASTWQCPPLEEDWEKDEEETPETFIYGYTNLNKNCIKASSVSAYESSHNITAGIRAPRSFPEQLSSSSARVGSIPFVRPWRIGERRARKREQMLHLRTQTVYDLASERTVSPLVC